MQGEGYKPDAIRGSGLATAATVLFGLTILINLGLLCAISFLVYYVLTRENSILVLLEQSVPIWRGARRLLDVQALATLSANVLFMIWLYVVHKDLRRSGARLKYSSHWAITGFLIPFLNFFRPFQVVRDIWRASSPTSASSLPGKTPAVIRLWWEAVLVSSLYGLAGGYILGTDRLEASGILLVWYLVSAAAGALAVAVVRLMERNLHRGEEAVPEATGKARKPWPAWADVAVLVLTALVTLGAYGHSKKTVSAALQAGILRMSPPPPPPAAPAQPGTAATGVEGGPGAAPVEGVSGVVGGVPGGVIGGVVGGRPGGLPPPPPPPPKRPLRIRVGGNVAGGNLVSRVAPIYPELAKRDRVQGDVIIKAVIDKNGKVREMQVVSGHPLLAQAAVDAVRQWQYRPYLLNGEPVEMETEVTVRFRLN